VLFFEQNIVETLWRKGDKNIKRLPECPEPNIPSCPPAKSTCPYPCPTCKACPTCDVKESARTCDNIEEVLMKNRYNVATEADLYAICPELDKNNFVENDSLIHIETDYFELSKNYSWMQNNVSVTEKEYQAYCAPYVYTRLKFGQLGVDIPVCVWPGDVDQIVSKSVIGGGFWDYNVATQMLVQVMGRDNPGIIIDGGVNIGEFTILSAYLGQTVVGFEPLPAHIDMVKRSLFLNNIHHNVYLVRNAISYTSGNMTLTVDNVNKGSSYVGTRKGSNTVDIDVVTYDMVIEKLKPKLGENFSVRYLKVDIEGYEPYFALGAKNFWFNHYIDGMAFELTDAKLKELKCNATLFNTFFQKLGYNIYYTKGEEQPRNYYFNEKKPDHFYQMLQKETLLDVFMLKKSPLA